MQSRTSSEAELPNGWTAALMQPKSSISNYHTSRRYREPRNTSIRPFADFHWRIRRNPLHPVRRMTRVGRDFHKRPDNITIPPASEHSFSRSLAHFGKGAGQRYLRHTNQEANKQRLGGAPVPRACFSRSQKKSDAPEYRQDHRADIGFCAPPTASGNHRSTPTSSGPTTS